MDPDALFELGREFYSTARCDKAIGIFEALVEKSPEESRYHHWLGKCYGRTAESANWLTAMSLALKTLESFRKAVELDGTNKPALEDLMQYYEDAPGFLGGSKKKAEEIRTRMEALQTETDGS